MARSNAERAADARDARLARGLCVDCGAPAEGRRCDACQGRANAGSTEQWHARVAAGLCTRCGVRLVGEGGVNCEACAETVSEIARERSAARRRLGLCIGCGSPRAPQRVRCLDCLAKVNAMRAARKEAGLCVDCGEPAAPDRVRCETHLEIRCQREIARRRAHR